MRMYATVWQLIQLTVHSCQNPSQPSISVSMILFTRFYIFRSHTSIDKFLHKIHIVRVEQNMIKMWRKKIFIHRNSLLVVKYIKEETFLTEKCQLWSMSSVSTINASCVRHVGILGQSLDWATSDKYTARNISRLNFYHSLSLPLSHTFCLSIHFVRVWNLSATLEWNEIQTKSRNNKWQWSVMFWMDWKLNSLSEMNWYPAMRIVRIYIIMLTDDS